MCVYVCIYMCVYVCIYIYIPGRVKPKTIIKMVQTASLHGTQCVRVGSKRLGSVWNCLWGHALKSSPGINRKSSRAVAWAKSLGGGGAEKGDLAN